MAATAELFALDGARLTISSTDAPRWLVKSYGVASSRLGLLAMEAITGDSARVLVEQLSGLALVDEYGHGEGQLLLFEGVQRDPRSLAELGSEQAFVWLGERTSVWGFAEMKGKSWLVDYVSLMSFTETGNSVVASPTPSDAWRYRTLQGPELQVSITIPGFGVLEPEAKPSGWKAQAENSESVPSGRAYAFPSRLGESRLLLENSYGDAFWLTHIEGPRTAESVAQDIETLRWNGRY